MVSPMKNRSTYNCNQSNFTPSSTGATNAPGASAGRQSNSNFVEQSGGAPRPGAGIAHQSHQIMLEQSHHKPHKSDFNLGSSRPAQMASLGQRTNRPNHQLAEFNGSSGLGGMGRPGGTPGGLAKVPLRSITFNKNALLGVKLAEPAQQVAIDIGNYNLVAAQRLKSPANDTSPEANQRDDHRMTQARGAESSAGEYVGAPGQAGVLNSVPPPKRKQHFPTASKRQTMAPEAEELLLTPSEHSRTASRNPINSFSIRKSKEGNWETRPHEKPAV